MLIKELVLAAEKSVSIPLMISRLHSKKWMDMKSMEEKLKFSKLTEMILEADLEVQEDLDHDPDRTRDDLQVDLAHEVLDALEVDQTNVQNHEADPDQTNDDLNRQRNLDHDPDQKNGDRDPDHELKLVDTFQLSF